MKINNHLLNPHVGLPSWLLALQQSLDGRDLRRPGRVLGPMTALDELESLATAAPPRAKEDVAALTADLGRALDALGPGLAAATHVGVAEFRRHTLSRLSSLLSTTDGLKLAATAARTLRGRLLSDDGAAAAWRDFVAAFQANERYDVCLDRWVALHEIVVHRGHAWESEAELIARVVNDSAEYAARAGAPIERPASRRWDIEDRAGLQEPERLALVERHLRAARDIEQVTVWLMVHDAQIARSIEAGPVLLIDSETLRKEVVENTPQPEAYGLPAQLEQFIAAQLLGDLPDKERAVIARVRTSSRAGEATEFARAAVRAVLDSTLLGEDTRGWELADGHLLSGENAWSHRRFSRRGSHRFDMSRMLARVARNPAAAVARVDARIIDAWASRRADAVGAVELARWERSLSRSGDDVFRVALGVRGLERTLPADRVADGSASAHWTKAVEYYLKDRWAWQVLRSDIDDVRVHVVSPPDERLGLDIVEMTRQHDDDRFYDRLRSIVGHESPSSDQVVGYAGQLRELMPEGSSRERLLRALAEDTATTESTLAWIGRLDAEFDARLARAARQRNATVHGTVTVPAVIEDALDMVESLSRLVVRDALAAVADNELLVDRLERLRLDVRERRASIQQGTSLAEIIRAEDASS